MSAIFFMEFKGFTAMATDLARGTSSIGLTPERIRAAGITVVDSLLRQASLSANPANTEHLGGDTWALVFTSLEDAVTFGCAILRGFQSMASRSAVFFLKPSLAVGVGDPKWKDGRPLDDISIATYQVADKGAPYDLILVGDAIPTSMQCQWITQGVETQIAAVALPLKRVDWQTSVPPKLVPTPDISVSIPPLLLDSEIIFSATTRDAVGRLTSQQAIAHEVLAFGGPVPYDIPDYHAYLRAAVLRLRNNARFTLSTLTYIPRSEAQYGYAWLELARRVRVECPSRFAPAAFLLPEEQLRPLSYHIYDEDLVHLGLRSFVPQRGVATMSASFLVRNRSIADRFRAEFTSNWRQMGLLDDAAFARLLQELPPISAAERREAILGYYWVRDGEGSPTWTDEQGTLQPSFDELVTDYEYDTDNRLTSSSEGTYEHDPNGNLVSRTLDTTTTTFTYDSEDRLTSQTTDTIAVEHIYDGDSHRIARIQTGGVNPGETRYVLDRGRSMSHVLCETNDAGIITAYYIHGPQLVARIEPDPEGAQRYYHTNDIGHVVALTDENEVVTDRYGYTPYGLLGGREGNTPNPFTYVGGLGVMEEADGLYFMRARFYDPVTGRFLGKDPVEGARHDPQALHRYVYGMDNPLISVDPTGEKLWKYNVKSFGVDVGPVSFEWSFDVQITDPRNEQRSCTYNCVGGGGGSGGGIGFKIAFLDAGAIDGPSDCGEFGGLGQVTGCWFSFGIGVEWSFSVPYANVFTIILGEATGGDYFGLRSSWTTGLGFGCSTILSYCWCIDDWKEQPSSGAESGELETPSPPSSCTR